MSSTYYNTNIFDIPNHVHIDAHEHNNHSQIIALKNFFKILLVVLFGYLHFV